ncbi:MAG TPA: helix-turn-helix transcriptional regulator [Caproicibacter sp.]|nr:helix-turn-helix transcriptional regulator [Caproicibacter sp.]
MKKIIVRTREIRLNKGLTCQQVADRCGISKAAVNRIENGTRDPGINTLFAISQALDVEFEEVYKIIDVEEPQE